MRGFDPISYYIILVSKLFNYNNNYNNNNMESPPRRGPRRSEGPPPYTNGRGTEPRRSSYFYKYKIKVFICNVM